MDEVARPDDADLAAQVMAVRPGRMVFVCVYCRLAQQAGLWQARNRALLSWLGDQIEVWQDDIDVIVVGGDFNVRVGRLRDWFPMVGDETGTAAAPMLRSWTEKVGVSPIQVCESPCSALRRVWCRGVAHRNRFAIWPLGGFDTGTFIAWWRVVDDWMTRGATTWACGCRIIGRFLWM